MNRPPPADDARPHTLRVVLLLGVWTLLLRGPAFPVTVLDWDETLYFMQAKELLRGAWIYDTIWDLKPVGIVLLFAGALAVLGEQMLSVRILAALFVVAAAYVLYRLLLQVCRDRRAALLSAFAYPAYTTGMGGMASNTEIFFAPLVALGMWIGYRGVARDGGAIVGHRSAALAGLAMGLAVAIKTVVVFEAAALTAFFLLSASAPRGRLRVATLTPLLTYGVAVVLPFAVAATVFWVGGRFDDFYLANVTAHRHYVSTPQHAARISYGLRLGLRPLLPLLLAIVVMVAVARRRRRHEPIDAGARRLGVLLTLWLAATSAAIVAMNQYMPHYFVSLAAPLCVGLGWALHGLRLDALTAANRRRLSIGITAVLLGLPFAASARNHLRRYRDNGDSWGDKYQRVARYIREHDPLHGPIYVVDTEFIIHHLADAPFLTRYIFPSHILYPHNWPITGARGLQEVDDIFAASPRFVVITVEGYAKGLSEAPVFKLVRSRIDARYELAERVDDLLVFERRGR